MPFDDPDATDPMTFHAVEIQTDNPDVMREMAACFVEEYARLGFDAGRIIELFRDGRFAGPALAYRRLGEDPVARIIRDQIQLRGPRGTRHPLDHNSSGAIELPILDQ